MTLRKTALKKSLLALAGFFACGMASAAVDEESSAPAYRLGGVTAYPGFDLVLKNDSNIFRYGDANPNKRSSKITVLSPSVVLQAEKGAHAYSLTYIADIGRYSNSPADNYVDQKFLGLAELGLSIRSTLTILPSYLIGHNDRGSTFGTATAEPSTWHLTGLNGSFSYGAEGARGRLLFDLGYTDLQYQNNRAVTTAYDRKQASVSGSFYLRMQPKTSLLVTAKHSGISYKQIGSIRNGNEQILWIGVKWETTARTSGEVKVGRLQKNFDSTVQSYSADSWEGDVRWSPVSYVNVDLVSSRRTNESTFAGSSAILVSNSGANIAYNLNARVTLHAKGYRVKEDFVLTNRVDYTDTWGLRAEYHFRSWLVGGVEFTNNARTSNNSLNDYSRNIFMLSVGTEL